MISIANTCSKIGPLYTWSTIPSHESHCKYNGWNIFAAAAAETYATWWKLNLSLRYCVTFAGKKALFNSLHMYLLPFKCLINQVLYSNLSIFQCFILLATLNNKKIQLAYIYKPMILYNLWCMHDCGYVTWYRYICTVYSWNNNNSIDFIAYTKRVILQNGKTPPSPPGTGNETLDLQCVSRPMQSCNHCPMWLPGISFYTLYYV